jgi:hypothetical protein
MIPVEGREGKFMSNALVGEAYHNDSAMLVVRTTAMTALAIFPCFWSKLVWLWPFCLFIFEAHYTPVNNCQQGISFWRAPVKGKPF